MIHKLILKNFKKIKDECFLFNNFDLVVGANNSGKSTILQAMAIWQYCVDQFRLSKKTGVKGIQIVLPNFTALPVPEFNLLWTDRTDRVYKPDPSQKGKRDQTYIAIEIDVFWRNNNNEEKHFCVQLSYHSPQSLYARPKDGWVDFLKLEDTEILPRIVYVPPFSGLEPHEAWMDNGNVRQNIGKAQPGSVLRNLLYRVIDREDVSIKDNQDWKEIVNKIYEWFNVELLAPEYNRETSTEIKVEYRTRINKKTYDIISGGSGFHQILTLLAFLYGYKGVTTILFDEPDAHLHVNLQRQIVNYFKKHPNIQFIISTHSEEFIKGIELNNIISILASDGKPKRIQSSQSVISALSDIDNIDVIRTQSSPHILYLEGEDDDRILTEWAKTLGKNDVYQSFYVYVLGGSTKNEMKQHAEAHFKALKHIVPNIKRALLFDRDSDDTAINPLKNQSTCNEWKRKNIDNYLLVPAAWKKAISKLSKINETDLFFIPYRDLVDGFFDGENLTLPKGQTWINLTASIFSIVDGKKLLFENNDSLFQRIKQQSDDLHLRANRSIVASSMTAEEIHQDIYNFFDNLESITKETEPAPR